MNRQSWKSNLSIQSIPPQRVEELQTAGIAGIVVIDLDGIWTFIPE